MENFFQILGYIAMALVGLVYLYQNVFRAKKDLRKEEDDSEDRVIKLLKERVDALETKTKEQQQQFDTLSKRFEAVEQERNVLKDVFQGRDPDSVKYREEGIKAMKKGEETHATALSIKSDTVKLLELMVKLDSDILKELQFIRDLVKDRKNS